MEGDPNDPNHELKLRPVFIRIPNVSREQVRAINTLRGQAKCASIDATDAVMKRCGGDVAVFAAIAKYIAEVSPITINVAPNVIGLLAKDTHLRNSFEVSTKGAGYDTWRQEKEDKVFLGLYVDKNGINAPARPKYGALNYLNNPGGLPGAMMYGRWHLVLHDSARPRCTLAECNTSGGEELGVLDFCMHVLMKLTDGEFAELIAVATKVKPYSDKYQERYREVQIHGDVLLGRDIAALCIPAADVADSTYQHAVAFSQAHNVPIRTFEYKEKEPKVAKSVKTPKVAKVTAPTP
jgi:Protein of unknown function (DUF3626)